RRRNGDHRSRHPGLALGGAHRPDPRDRVARRADAHPDRAVAAVPDRTTCPAVTLTVRTRLLALGAAGAVALGVTAAVTYVGSSPDPLLAVGAQGVLVAAPTGAAQPPGAVPA